MLISVCHSSVYDIFIVSDCRIVNVSNCRLARYINLNFYQGGNGGRNNRVRSVHGALCRANIASRSARTYYAYRLGSTPTTDFIVICDGRLNNPRALQMLPIR